MNFNLINNASGYNIFFQTNTSAPNVLGLNALFTTYYGSYINTCEIDSVNASPINGHLYSMNFSIITCLTVQTNCNSYFNSLANSTKCMGFCCNDTLSNPLYINPSQCIGTFNFNVTTGNITTCTGSCCLSNNTCLQLNNNNCLSNNGIFNDYFTTCELTQCQVPIVNSACCLRNGTCLDTTNLICSSLEGNFIGNNTICLETRCPIPTGACCEQNSCTQQTRTNCLLRLGIYQGDFTSCNTCNIINNGSCCLQNGTCLDSINQNTCLSLNGFYNGDNTSCSQFSCNPSIGSCCVPFLDCIEVDLNTCLSYQGIFQGYNTNCLSTQCPNYVLGGCCLKNGTCLNNVNQSDCSSLSGSFSLNTPCSQISCLSSGGCCLLNGTCKDVTQPICDTLNGIFQGNNTLCLSTRCNFIFYYRSNSIWCLLSF